MMILDIICTLVLIAVSAGMLQLGFSRHSNYDDFTKGVVLVIVSSIAYALLRMWG